MKEFELNEDSLRKCWGGADQYWFSLNDYKIRDVSSLAQLDRPEQISPSAYFVSLGYIPYCVVTNEEIMRAYVNNMKDTKLKSALSKIDDDNFVESFWKYFNIYPQLSEEWLSFEKDYLLKKAGEWCEENGINYAVNITEKTE